MSDSEARMLPFLEYDWLQAHYPHIHMAHTVPEFPFKVVSTVLWILPITMAQTKLDATEEPQKRHQEQGP